MMRNFALTLTCAAALFAPGCGTPSATNNTNGNANSSAATTTGNVSSRASNAALPPVSSAHGDNPTGVPPATTAPAASSASSAKPAGIDTAALDARIKRAEAKAKGGNQADKLAAAAAYVARGNAYRDAGQPTLYKFALGDYRHALRYQPDNAEAREKMNEIVSIYQSMGRPVPENGNEP